MNQGHIVVHTISSSSSDEGGLSDDETQKSSRYLKHDDFTELNTQTASYSYDSESSNSVKYMDEIECKTYKYESNLNMSLMSRLKSVEGSGSKSENANCSSDDELPDLDPLLADRFNPDETCIRNETLVDDDHPVEPCFELSNNIANEEDNDEHPVEPCLELSDDDVNEENKDCVTEIKTADKLKEARKFVCKISKYEQCVQFIKVAIDKNIVQDKAGKEQQELIEAFRAGLYEHEIRNELLQNCITFHRKLCNESSNSQTQVLQHEWVAEDQVIVVIDMDDFKQMIANFKTQSSGVTLASFKQTVNACYPQKKITFVVCGAEQYFKKVKAQQARQFKNNVMCIEPSQAKRKKVKESSCDDVSKVDMEEVIVNLHLHHPHCNIRFIDKMSQLPNLISTYTKSIAIAPYKKEEMKNNLTWFIEGDNKRCVRVDKNGRFLSDLWQMQLQCFANVGVDVAVAIVQHFPNPQALLQAFKQSKNPSLLLQDLNVRRQAGPLTTSRRIGPELSKKIHAFFTSRNGKKLVHKL